MSPASKHPTRAPITDMVKCLASMHEDRRRVQEASDRALVTFLASVAACSFGGDASQAMLGAKDRGSGQIRDLAIYLAHTKFELSQARAATVFKLARQSGTRAVQRVEEAREDSVFNWKLEQVEQLIDQEMEAIAA